jgi:hypothetical protein
MKRSFASTVLLLVFMACAGSNLGRAEELHHERPAVFGFDLKEGWFDPPVHSHRSALGTPMIHPFRTEPAFTQRDVILDYSTRSQAGQREQEIAAEVEWPLSRRLGLIFETPYVFLDPDDGGSIDGFGNLAISPRVLLVETERFLLASALEIETTAGDTATGIAEDEVALAPSFSTWIDLGGWWALNSQLGLEYPVESHDAELFIRSALIHTFRSGDTHDVAHTHDDHAHGLSAGLVVSAILEVDLAVGLSGEGDGDWFAEGIVGMLVNLSDNADVRVGYEFPLSTRQDLNNGFTGGLLWHLK